MSRNVEAQSQGCRGAERAAGAEAGGLQGPLGAGRGDDTRAGCAEGASLRPPSRLPVSRELWVRRPWEPEDHRGVYTVSWKRTWSPVSTSQLVLQK